MDVLKHAYTVVSVIIEAIQTCQSARSSQTSGRGAREWGSELKFCTSLQSTLEDIIAWQPSDANFTHDYELGCLINTVSQHLEHFCDGLAKCTPILQEATENIDSSKRDNAAQLESQLRSSFMQPVKTLRKQSPPLEPIPKDEIAEIKSIGLRAKILFADSLQKSLQSPSTIQSLSIPKQQKFLNSLEGDAKRHWELVQLTIYGAWGDAMELSEDDLSSAASSGRVTPGNILPSNQAQKHQDSRRQKDNEKRNDQSLPQPPTHHSNRVLGSRTTHDQSLEYRGPSIPAQKVDKSFSGPAITTKEPSPAMDVTRSDVIGRNQTIPVNKPVTSSSTTVSSHNIRPTNDVKHKNSALHPMAESKNRPSTESPFIQRLQNMSPTCHNLRDGQFKVQSEQRNLHSNGADGGYDTQGDTRPHYHPPQQLKGAQGSSRQQNQQNQSPSRQLQSDGEDRRPQHQHDQQRPNQQGRPQQQQTLQQSQPHSRPPQRPERREYPSSTSSGHVGSIRPTRDVPNNTSRRVE